MCRWYTGGFLVQPTQITANAYEAVAWMRTLRRRMQQQEWTEKERMETEKAVEALEQAQAELWEDDGGRSDDTL